MSDFRNYRDEWKKRAETKMEQRGHNHIWTGLFLLIIGGLALAKSVGTPMPVWLFTWQMLLIAIGLLIGLKRGFRDGGWFIPIIIGGAFLVNEYFIAGDLRRHIWPTILIIIGLFFIFRPRKRWYNNVCTEKKTTGDSTDALAQSKEDISRDDIIESTCIFSGAKRVVLSKTFKGGELVNIFGGCEVDLMQADVTSPAIIEVTAIFGGATLIVPSNWAIKSEAVTIFGGISDKRRFNGVSEATNKTLILKGALIFGGMEIKSY